MQLKPRFGRCILSFLPDEDSILKPGMKFGIILPKHLQKKARTAFVHLHYASQRFGENLTNKTVVADRWSGTRFTVVYNDGKEYEFYSISEWAIYAVFEGSQP